MGKDGVTGIIVPVPSAVANRIFHHHDVYAMLSEADSTPLAPGDRIFFYDTGGKGLEGEASIDRLSFAPASEVRGYGHDLHLSQEELSEYLLAAGAWEDSIMLVLRVKDATKYSRPLRCSLHVGEHGLLVTPDVFSKIMDENQ